MADHRDTGPTAGEKVHVQRLIEHGHDREAVRLAQRQQPSTSPHRHRADTDDTPVATTNKGT